MEIDAATGRVQRVVEVGPDPLVAVGAGGAVWTHDLNDASLTRIDPVSGETTRPAAGEVAGLGRDGADV